MYDLTRQKRNKTFGLQIILFLSLISLMMSGFSVKTAYAATIQAPAADPTISINDMTVVEGTGPVGSVTFTVTLSEASGNTITVDYTTNAGTATGGGVDYTDTSETLTFAPGQISKPIVVYINADSVDEVDEIFYVDLSLPTNATLGDSQGVGTIDDDDGPNISINSPSITEGNSGSVYLNFQVNLSGTSVQTVYVDYNTVDGTATAGADYIANSGTLTFVPGDTAETITIEVLGDELDEANDTFNVILSNPMDGFITTGTGEGTITDDDALPVFSIAPITVTVVEGLGVTVNFTVTLTPVSGRETRVNYSTAAGTASATQDFYAISATTLIFAEGETSKVITATLRNDDVDENPETFDVRLTNPVFATVATAPNNEAEVTIDDDDPEPTITIADPPIKTEGAAGTTTTIEFTVQLSHATSRGTTVYYQTSSGSGPGDATPGVDYVEKTGSVTIANNASSAKFTVTINGDALDELDEVFTVTLTSATYATIVDDTAIGTINDDDGPAISISDSFTLEGTGGFSTAAFALTLSASSPQTVTVNYRTSNGSANADDYIAIPATPPSTVVFAPGTTVSYAYVSIVGDSTDEVDETFNVILSSPVDATILSGHGTGVGTIDDDDGPNILINDVTVTEGTTGSTTNATFNVTLSYKSKQAVTVNYAVAGGSATTDVDYIAASGVLTFPVNMDFQTITVVVKGDTLDEIDETYNILFTDPVDASANDTGVGTIDDDDGPAISIADTLVTEGNAGDANAVFVVSLSEPSVQVVNVQYITQDNTATIADNDYLSASEMVTFTIGSITQAITVTVKGDTTDEVDETFFVILSSPVNATLQNFTGTGTIDDDDGPEISITDAVVIEGDADPIDAEFVISLSSPSLQTITVDYSTSDSTAKAGKDYDTTSGTAILPAGTLTQTVSVAVLGDLIDEYTEQFTVSLTAAVNGMIVDPSGNGVIEDNDSPPSISIADITTVEGDSGLTPSGITVTLSAPSEKTVTVNYSTADITAEAPYDYAPIASGNLSFAPGETSKTAIIYLLGDETDETDETFWVLLSDPNNVSISDGTGVGTIDDDDGPGISINAVTVTEGSMGETTDAVFTVTLSYSSEQEVTVNYVITDVTATEGVDYIAASGVLTFPVDETVQTISVAVHGDVEDEIDETFHVLLSDAVDASIVENTGVGTIADDDEPNLSISNASVFEGNSGSVSLTFTITLSAPSPLTVTLDFATSDGSATAGIDYEAASGTLKFAPGETTKTITIIVYGDTLSEADEIFLVNLSGVINAILLNSQGEGIILSDDFYLYLPLLIR